MSGPLQTLAPFVQRTRNWARMPVVGWLLAAALLVLLGAAAAAGDIGAWASPWLHSRQQELLAWHARGPWLFGMGLFVLFTLLSALALPGCSVLALAAGATLGWALGTALVALASTAGATLSFLAARHWWRDTVRQRWGHRLAPLEEGLARDGALYLFVLRMVPLIPFPLLNPLMGLSAMPVTRFAVTSLLGMLLGSAAFVYAGTGLASASSGAVGGAVGGAVNWASAPLLLGLSVALVLPLLVRRWWQWRCERA
jgi:uncharacterized membrane protein YdjX (TVP38/TMEM64 family)